MVMQIYISNNLFEFYHAEKTFKENIYRGAGVLTLGSPLVIRLQNVSLHPWLIQLNHRAPSDQLIWITKIYING